LSADVPAVPSFAELGLSEATLAALDAVGYEAPSPIQARTIPLLLAGRDVLGQAQTGTGKTAAFALPLIDRLDVARREPQVLVLTPTRELAIQVAEAFQRYASRKPGFHVLPIYGGQPYPTQVRPLKRGVHVVVGTPGRVMDHMRRGTLKLGGLISLVLDEADEMLAMGFLEDVTWILEQTPEQRQIALFSATMPPAVRRITEKYLDNPEVVALEVRTTAATTIRQRYQLVPHNQKLDALTRLLEVEPGDGMLIFVRTKTATVELAEKLEARGYATAALNGDIAQPLRERTVERFKTGKLDLLVATDVAARGLDVERISHVLNYDIPHGPEAYIHRIGRTGRAGRSGEAILFVTPRERNMLKTIERTIGHPIEVMTVPSTDEVNKRRIARFKERISEVSESRDTSFFERLLEEYIEETDSSPIAAAAALALLLQGSQPFLMTEPKRPAHKQRPAAAGKFGKSGKRPDRRLESGMQRFRIEVGHQHGVKPGQIMGAIANEAGLDGKHIGRIDIRDDHSLVDLPEGMPPEIFKAISKARLCRQRLRISRPS
jgi:ATP-dependent RNA helicase DeaD